jgi:AraC-like DNA-binding protein
MRLLVARGVDLLALIDGLDLSPAVFADPDGWIPWNVCLTLLDRAVEITHDPGLGIHAAEHIHHGDFDAVELVARASGTRRGALLAVSRYAGLMKDGAVLTHSVSGKDETWTLTLPPPNPRVAVEYTLGIFVLVGRTLSGGSENPDEIHLAFPCSTTPEDYERAFGCKVRFEAAESAFVMSTERLDKTIARITPSLALAMEEQARRLLAELPTASKQSMRVREQILEVLRAGPASLEEVSERLKTSARTLRRRLQEEGQTFSGLLSEVRRELAQQYLEDPERSVTEVAFLLGFADTSAFQRAFRKWFGTSPSEYRRTRKR